MIELKKLSNEALLQETKNRVVKERHATLATIECLEEVESRMLHLEMGYSSLWSFCIGFLGLSEGASQRRISAMRLGRKVPEAKQALQEGTLSLSVASQLQSFFLSEKKNGNDTSILKSQEVVQAVTGMTQSECEKRLFEISPAFEVKQKEVLRAVSNDQSVLKLILDSKVVAQLNLLKNRLAHTLPGASYTDIVTYLIEEKLVQIEKKKGATSVQVSNSIDATAIANKVIKSENHKIKPIESTANPFELNQTELKQTHSEEQLIDSSIQRSTSHRQQSKPTVQEGDGILSFAVHTRTHIPAAIDRELWKRSQGKCEFVSRDGKRCNSTFALEREHIVPVSLGGTNELKNIAHLCKSHHRQSTLKVFGKVAQRYMKA